MFHQTPSHSLTLLSCKNQPTFHISPLILYLVRTVWYRPQQNSDMPEESDWELFCVNSARGSYWTQSSWR